MLSACHRTEFYLAAPPQIEAPQQWLSVLRQYRPDAPVLRDDCHAWRRRVQASVCQRLRAGFGDSRRRPDPGPDEQAVVGLLDFGCAKESRRRGLLGLIACAEGDSGSTSVDGVMGHFLILGFNADLPDPMAHLLPELARVLFAPFRTRTDFDLTSWELGSRVEQILGSFRWNARCAGAADLIFFMRAFPKAHPVSESPGRADLLA